MVLILIVIPTAFHFFAANSANAGQIIRVGWFITAILLLFEVVRFVVSLIVLRSTLITITSQRVMIERGLLSKSLSEIDLRTIDDTQFYQGLFDRMLGIGNVTIISSDKSTPVYVLAGVRDPRTLRETIRTNAYRVSQRQIFTRTT